MNHLKWIPLLFLVACATDSPPTIYGRGTLRPPPPTLRPGHGLPTFEPHPEVKPQVQPQPKQAPVPHTARTAREDTIWAGDAPRASADESDPAYVVANPKLFGLPVPVPDGLSPLPSGECAAKLALAAWRAGLEAMARDVPEPMRQCLIGHLMVKCTEREVERAKGLPDPTLHVPRWEAANAAAARHKAKACHVAPLDKAATILRDHIVEHMEKNR